MYTSDVAVGRATTHSPRTAIALDETDGWTAEVIFHSPFIQSSPHGSFKDSFCARESSCVERSELFAAYEQEVLRTPSACGCPDAKRTPTRGQAIGPLMGIAKEKPGGIKCGTFGCPLPNLHSGLCQPCVATRFSRRSGAVSGSRRGCPGYVRRPTIVFKPKTEFPYHPTYVGPRHQVDYVPACSPSHCTRDRGDERILVTATEVRAHMDAERAAAAAWEERVTGKQSSSMDRSGSPSQSEVKIEKVPSTPLKTSNPNVNLASARARPALSFVNTRHRSMIGS